MCASVEADRSQFYSLRALVEERHEEERAQRVEAEATLKEKLESLSQQLQGAKETNDSLEEQLRASKDSLRKSAAQLCALGQRREQERKQAHLVEQALREEIEKVRESARERERQGEDREGRAAATASARAREAADLTRALARLEDELRESRDGALRLQMQHQQEREQVDDERLRRQTHDAEREQARAREEELKLRGLEQSFLAMFEEALCAALAPFSEGMSVSGDDRGEAQFSLTYTDDAGVCVGGGEWSVARLSASHVTWGAPTPPPAVRVTPAVGPNATATATAAASVLTYTATSSPLAPPTPSMASRNGERLIFSDLARVGTDLRGQEGGKGGDGGCGGGVVEEQALRSR